MIFSNDRLSIRQTQALLICEIFGTAVVFMPSFLWQIMGGKSIFALAFAILGLFLSFFVIGKVYGKNETSFGETVYKSAGNTLGKIIIIAFWVKIVVAAGLWLREFSLILCEKMLPQTPFQIVAAVIMISCFYLAEKNLEVRGRTAEIFIIFMALMFIPVLFMAGIEADYTNILPLSGIKLGELSAASVAAFSALGSADYVWFLYPKTDHRKGGIWLSAAIIGILLLITTVVVFGVFGESVTKPWAVLGMMDTVDFPGAFIERQDVLMLGFWIMSFFIYLSGGITYGTYLIGEITGKVNYIVSGVAVYALSVFLPPIFTIEKVLLITTPLFLIVLPIFLAAAKSIRRRAQ